MSYRHTAYALDAAEALTLSPRAAHLLLIIATHAGADGICWPSVARLAKLARRDRSNVLDGLVELETSGALAVDRRPGRANRYRLPVLDVLSTTSGADATGRRRVTSGASTTHQWRSRHYTRGAGATRTDQRTVQEHAAAHCSRDDCDGWITIVDVHGNRRASRCAECNPETDPQPARQRAGSRRRSAS